MGQHPERVPLAAGEDRLGIDEGGAGLGELRAVAQHGRARRRRPPLPPASAPVPAAAAGMSRADQRRSQRLQGHALGAVDHVGRQVFVFQDRQRTRQIRGSGTWRIPQTAAPAKAGTHPPQPSRPRAGPGFRRDCGGLNVAAGQPKGPWKTWSTIAVAEAAPAPRARRPIPGGARRRCGPGRPSRSAPCSNRAGCSGRPGRARRPSSRCRDRARAACRQRCSPRLQESHRLAQLRVIRRARPRTTGRWCAG